jgi:hypothetical protein
LKGAAVDDNEIIALLDQKLDEKFHQMTLHLERLKEEFVSAHIHFDFHEMLLKRLKDELTLPSGKVTQQFSALEERIEQLGGKAKRPSVTKKSSR